MAEGVADTVGFTRMADGDQADYDLLAARFTPYLAELPGRIVAALEAQRHERSSGHQISRCDHALQAATRARRAGADVDWIAAALVHDIGDGLAPLNHAAMAAAILEPYVREEVTWTVRHHGAFQLQFSGRYNGGDPNAREAHRGSPYFESCAGFCEQWDQCSFDPAYDTDALDSFADELSEVFSRPAHDPDRLQPGLVIGIPS